MTEFTILYMSLCRTGQFIIPILNKSKEFEDTKSIRSVDNTMINRKMTKEQTTIYIKLHRNLKTEQHESH